MQKRESIVQGIKGDAIAGVSVRVVLRNTETPAVLYADDGSTTISNPIVTGKTGTYAYYAANGRYDEEIIIGGVKFATISDVKLYDRDDDTTIGVTESALASVPAFRQVPGEQVLSGRQRDLANFAFASIYANGTIYPANTIQTVHANGIGSGASAVLNRVTDEVIVGTTTSQIPAQDRAVWELSLLPSHVVTIGRPRTQIIGQELKFNTPYRMSLMFKLKQPDAIGWNNRSAGPFSTPLFVISQLPDEGTQAFSSGQSGDAASPVYIILRGGYMYPDIRVIGEELGLFPGDPGSVVSYPQWAAGDCINAAFNLNPFQSVGGVRYHLLEIFFSLDDRRGKDGGKGYVRAYLNGQLWFQFSGMSCAPKNEYGNAIPCHSRLGFYETSTTPGVLADGTAVSTIPSCSINRVLKIKHYSIVEVKA